MYIGAPQCSKRVKISQSNFAQARPARARERARCVIDQLATVSDTVFPAVVARESPRFA